jgi:hypothetical protein
MMDLNGLLRKAPAGSTISLPSGTYEGGVRATGLRGITLQGSPGAVIQAAHLPYALRFEDCIGLALRGLEIAGGGKGIFCPNSHNLLFEGLYIHDTTGDGITTGKSKTAKARSCRFVRCGVHGLYYSDNGGGDYEVSDCAFDTCGGASLQVNAVPYPNARHAGDTPAVNVLLQRNTFTHGHGAAINLAFVQHAQVLANRILDGGHLGVALFNDDAGARYACRDVLLAENEIANTRLAAVSIGPGSQGVTIQGWAKLRSRVPVDAHADYVVDGRKVRVR